MVSMTYFAVCSLMVLYLLLTHLQLKELTNARKSYIECYKMIESKENPLSCKCKHIHTLHGLQNEHNISLKICQ